MNNANQNFHKVSPRRASKPARGEQKKAKLVSLRNNDQVSPNKPRGGGIPTGRGSGMRKLEMSKQKINQDSSNNLGASQPNLKGYETVNQHVMPMPPSAPDSGDDYEPGKASITPVETKKRPAVGSKKNSMKITKAGAYAPSGSSNTTKQS